MEISSLARLCLVSVADNIAMWCESALKDDFYKYLYAIGPFNDLNSTLIQELVNISYDKQLLKASYFPLLFHENFTKLDLSRCHSMITDQVLKLVVLRCKRLTYLNLNGCSRLSNYCLNETLPTLQFLRSLQLSNCRSCSDQLLLKFAKSCRNLQELVVNLCPKVTDVEINALFAQDNPDEAGCFDIMHLDVSATSVTTKSLGVILLGLSKLKKLSFSDLSGESYQNHLGLVGIPSLSIEHLDLFGTFLKDSSLKLLIENCPKLVVLRLNMSTILSEIVANHLPIFSLYLTSLDLGGASDGILFEDVEKFLEKRGGQLESLNLSEMPNVRIFVLCMYCKSLKELVLAHCENVDPILPVLDDLTKEQRDNLRRCAGNRLSDFCPQLFCINLNFTTFRGPPELQPISASNILCDHSNLVRLSLKDVDINDDILLQVCNSSSNLVLRILDLSNCNGITVVSVRSVVENCRNLRLLDLSHCKQIDLASVSQIKKNLKGTRRNFLQIVWV